MIKRITQLICLLVISLCLFSCETGSSVTTKYDLILAKEEITIQIDEVNSYDYLSLFTGTIDGVSTTIPNESIINTVKPAEGNYSYTVTFHGVTKTLIVKVVGKTDVIEITPVTSLYSLKKSEADSFDFTSLFNIKINGIDVLVEKDYISVITSSSNVLSVSCTYQGKKETCVVQLVDIVYEIDLSEEDIYIKVEDIDNYDFLSKFTLTADGSVISITKEMIETNVEKAEGSYYYTVSYKGVSKTLNVHVSLTHLIEAIASNDIKIQISKAKDFDYTKLFILIVDGELTKVEDKYIILDNMDNIEIGNVYKVKLNYSNNYSSITKEVKVIIVEDDETIIHSFDRVIYPNSEIIDLRSLFSVYVNGELQEISNDDITGDIDYTQEGKYTITLNYQGQTREAVVEIKKGVILQPRTTKDIIVVKGTDINQYDFYGDVSVIINGIRFKTFDMNYFDLSNVDFNQSGTYEVVLTIPYNEKRVSLSGVNFEKYELTLKYKVVDNYVKFTVKEDELLVDTTKEFKPFSNIVVSVNGKNKALTTNPAHVDGLTVYATYDESILDLSNLTSKLVTIYVYADGIDKDPYEISYTITANSNVSISSIPSAMFSSESIDLRSLFTIVENGNNVDVTYDMLSGMFDSFTPGIYNVTATYKNKKATSNIVVLNSDILGVYHTNMTLIPSKVVDDYEDDYSEGYMGDDFIVYGVQNSNSNYEIKDLIINKDGTITYHNNVVTITKAIDPNTFIAESYSYMYTFTYIDGMMYIEPDNAIKLQFHEQKRPFIYFKDGDFELLDRVEINNNGTYVLSDVFTNFSFDCIEVRNNLTSDVYWYGLKTSLVEHMSSDTVYEVSHGYISFGPDFKKESNNTSTLQFSGEEYKFTMSSSNIGKISKTEKPKKYQGKSFSGTILDKTSKVTFDQYENATITIDNKKAISMISMHIESLKNGGFDYDNNTLFLYTYKDQDYGVTSYKVVLDPLTNTFTFVERDKYFGLYETDNMFIFIDGYGSGHISFNNKSYVTTIFTYTVNNNLLTLKFKDTREDFAYGEEMILSVKPYLNEITIIDSISDNLVDETFVNNNINDGAIINFSNYKVGQNSDKVAKEALFNNITIITKDGEMSNADKTNAINTSSVRFSKPGFYQISITLDVFGEEVTTYYAIEVIKPIYENNPVVGTYSTGVINQSFRMIIDIYGQVTLVCNDTSYIGMINIANDYSFTATISNDIDTLTLKGNMISDGLISVRVSGAVMFNDYFAKNAYSEVGCESVVLREFKTADGYIYVASSSKTSMGEVVEVSFDTYIEQKLHNNAIIYFEYNNKTIYATIERISDLSKGLVLADDYLGIYNNGVVLSLNGFGLATYNGSNGDYEITNGLVVYTSLTNVLVFRVDKQNKTYEIVDVKLDETLVSGKTFSGTYMFICNDEMYNATTAFTFSASGKVSISSTSSDHDDPSSGCYVDTYAPVFATKEGTYTVNGNVVSVNALGYTFKFKIDNVLKPGALICISTSLPSTEQGQFGANTKFLY